MFYLSLIILPEIIEPQTVFFYIDGLFELMPEFRELCCVEAAFENRILHSLSVTHADLCYLPKTFFPFCRLSSSGFDVGCSWLIWTEFARR